MKRTNKRKLNLNKPSFDLNKLSTGCAPCLEEAIKIELPWYKKIDSWETFCAYAGSTESKEMLRPAKCILSYGEWNPIGVDNE